MTIAAPVQANTTMGKSEIVYPTPLQTMESTLLTLTNKFDELAIQVAGAKAKRDQPIDDRANVWCTNCKGQGHMLPDCPSPLNQPPLCRFCGGHHDISCCNKLSNNSGNENKERNRRGQIYQIEDGNNNQPAYNSNNSNNWNNNRNNGNHDRRNNRNQYPNPNFNNSNNFNNGGYQKNPNRYIPNQNQGWTAMPFGNSSRNGPSYGGMNPSWENNPNVQCYNCG